MKTPTARLMCARPTHTIVGDLRKARANSVDHALLITGTPVRLFIAEAALSVLVGSAVAVSVVPRLIAAEISKACAKVVHPIGGEHAVLRSVATNGQIAFIHISLRACLSAIAARQSEYDNRQRTQICCPTLLHSSIILGTACHLNRIRTISKGNLKLTSKDAEPMIAP
jgi:uncharacterized membrane protein YqgA involved in biofilm formation